jgi:DHA1 family bicyclomycin/chloramphenicol resistance-like MFS transporter
MNAACAVLANFVANKFLRGVGPRRLIMWGLGLSMTGTVLTAATWMLGAPVWAIAASITFSMAPIGLNGPNIVGLALNQVTHSTGSAAATIGFVQFTVGALISPLVGLWGSATLAPSIIMMLLLAATSMTFLLVSGRSRERSHVTSMNTG